METDVKSLYDEVVTLKTAIEEAIIKRQKSLAGLEDIPASRLVPDEELVLARINTGSGVVGWLDDF